MLNSQRLLLGAGLILGLGACATVPQGPALQPIPVDRSIIPRELPGVADQRSYRTLLDAARDWQRRAAEAGGEWRDVERLLAASERSAASGDYSRAIDLAETARFQAEMGYRQMKAQEQVGNPPFLYY